MALLVIDAVSDSRAPQNEDIYGHGGEAAWVLDGATGLSDRPLLSPVSDAYAFVETIHSSLLVTTADVELPLTRVVEQAIATAAARFRPSLRAGEAQAYEMPSATLALVRTGAGALECSVLGDCRVIVQSGSEVAAVGEGSRLEALDRELLQRIGRLNRQGITDPDQVRTHMMPYYRAQRALMNTADGYWVLGFQPEAARHLQTRVLPATAGTNALLVSDGFYRLVDTFKEHTPRSLLQAAAGHGLRPLIERLRRLEDADQNCLRFPRLKTHDDATALLVAVGA